MAQTLADYVWGDQKNDFTGYYGQASTGAYSFTTTASGQTVVPTMADVDAASKPEDKLKLLTQLADVVNVQADAAISTGRSNAVVSMSKSTQEVLTSLSKVIDGLKTTDGSVAAGQKDPALKAYSSQINSVLTSVRNAMDKINTINSGASADVASQVSSDLTSMDNQAGNLATLSGNSWSRSGSTFRADPSKLLDILV